LGKSEERKKNKKKGKLFDRAMFWAKVRKERKTRKKVSFLIALCFAYSRYSISRTHALN